MSYEFPTFILSQQDSKFGKEKRGILTDELTKKVSSFLAFMKQRTILTVSFLIICPNDRGNLRYAILAMSAAEHHQKEGVGASHQPSP